MRQLSEKRKKDQIDFHFEGGVGALPVSSLGKYCQNPITT